MVTPWKKLAPIMIQRRFIATNACERLWVVVAFNVYSAPILTLRVQLVRNRATTQMVSAMGTKYRLKRNSTVTIGYLKVGMRCGLKEWPLLGKNFLFQMSSIWSYIWLLNDQHVINLKYQAGPGGSITSSPKVRRWSYNSTVRDERASDFNSLLTSVIELEK